MAFFSEKRTPSKEQLVTFTQAPPSYVSVLAFMSVKFYSVRTGSIKRSRGTI